MTEENTDAPVQTEVVETPVETPSDTPAETPGETRTEAPKTGPKPWEPAALRRETAKKHAEADRANKAEAEVARLRALLPDGEKEPPDTSRRDTVQQEAARMVREQQFNERRIELIQAGTEALGQATWNEKTEVLAGLGATDSPAFMEALVEMPNAAALVAALADDSARLEKMLTKSPAAMAAEMGRMSAELATPKAAPTKTLSNAPKPLTPTNASRGTGEPDIYKPETMSMKEWAAAREKTAPRSLGGRATAR